jgi:5-methylcytosine-specific restriction endonuclease McrA
MRRDGNLCVYCGSSEDLTLDHIIPWVQGGEHHLMNLVTACNLCNIVAGDRLFRTFSDRKSYVLARREQLTPHQVAHILSLGKDIGE